MSSEQTLESWSTIEELCARHLRGRLSTIALALLKKTEHERQEVRDFIARTFRLMQIARVDASDISPGLAWGLGVMLPGFLPGAWGGSLPPFTWEDRHKRIDAYLSSNPYADFPAGTVLLDMGCGFPPQTAVDASLAHPNWQIVGADPCFDEYLLYDARDNYACLEANGIIRYFQASANDVAGIRELYDDRSAAFRRFSELFSRLRPLLPKLDETKPCEVEQQGARLMRHPLRFYETANLKLIQAGIGSDLPPSDIVRCFNVMPFFNAQFQCEARDWAARVLLPGGLLLCGRDGPRSTEACYEVECREGDRLVPKEFAFSIDNLRSATPMPWFALHDDEPSSFMLAWVTGILRADGEFWSAFGLRYDELLAANAMFVRDTDGFLVPSPAQRPQSEWIDAREQMLCQLERDGFPDRAAQVLRRSGLNAWVNDANHVAIDLRELRLRTRADSGKET